MRHQSPSVSRRKMLCLFATTAASTVLAACGEAASTATAPPRTPSATSPVAPTVPAATTGMTMSTMPPATTGVTVPTMPPAMTANRKIAIEYWHSNTDRLGGGAIHDTIQRFNMTNPTVTVTEKVYPNAADMPPALQAAIPAKTQPAVAQISFANVQYVATQLPHLSIDEAAKRDVQGKGTEWLTQGFAPYVLDLSRVDGVLHALANGYSVALTYWNPELFKQAGLDHPGATWDEIRSQAQQITQRTGNVGLYLSEGTGWIQCQTLTESNGARTLVGSGKDLRCAVDSPETIEAMQFYADLVLKDKSAIHTLQLQGQQSFTNGDIGMYILQYSSNTESVRQTAKFDLRTAQMPSFGAKQRRIGAGGNAVFITGSTPDQQMAGWEWIKFLNSPESVTALVKGSGYLPVRSDLADDPRYLKMFLNQNPLIQPAVQELPFITQWVSFPGKNGLEADKTLGDARSQILTGQDVTMTLRDAARQVNQLIQG